MPSLDLSYPPAHSLSPSARTSLTRIEMGEPNNAPSIVQEPEPQVPPPSEPKHDDPAPQPVPPPAPQVHLTFLLISGRRRTMSFEPETTVGRVKELVWNAWPTGTTSSPTCGAPGPNHIFV